jgi:hypothetical protein
MEEMKQLEALPAAEPAAPAEVPGTMLMQMLDEEGAMIAWDKRGGAFRSSLETETEEGKSKMMRCLQRGDVGSKDYVNKVFHMEHYYVHPILRTDPLTGEIEPRFRIVMLDPDGKTLSTSSKACADMLNAAIRLYKNGPWKPPLPCLFAQVKSSEPGPDGKPKYYSTFHVQARPATRNAAKK